VEGRRGREGERKEEEGRGKEREEEGRSIPPNRNSGYGLGRRFQPLGS